jgi:glucose/arabinose dehydrogenase
MGSRPDGSMRTKCTVALVVAMTVASSLAIGVRPGSVEAAGPGPGKCQKGFLKQAQPSIADCPTATDPTAVAAALPAGFQETAVWSGLTNPTAIRFAADGRAFVAEKSGVIKVFDGLSDATPTTFSGLTTKVHNFWDRGLLGLALDPSMTGGSGNGEYVYVMYAYDHILGSTSSPPRWGDTCPTPPGATTDGCVVSSRISRFPVVGSSITDAEQVLVEDWCQQFPSHSAGTLTFGPDGALYASGGDGASFNTVDFGQLGGTTSPVVTGKNPCADAPNDAMTPPSAEGGALRSQDLRTMVGGPDYRQTILADAPIAYWRLGEASGGTAFAEVGQSGTYQNAPTLGQVGALAGDGNTAVSLNGTDEQITVADSSPFRFAGTAPFSAEAWFKHTPDGTDRPIFAAYNATPRGWEVWSTSGNFGFARKGSAGNQFAEVFGTSAPSVNAWHHVVATYDGANMRVYLDGALIAGPVASSTPIASDSTLRIGNYGSRWWNGLLDELAIYDYALPLARVQAHYNAGISGGGGSSDPVSLDGAVLRLDPNTGAGLPGNPFAASPDANARRIIAYGFRNPFRVTFRPGTNELWVGDVGWNTWEEIDKIPNATDGVFENFGWPCYEGAARQPSYDGTNLGICETLYAAPPSTVTNPVYAYDHAAKVVSTDACPTGGSSITGLAFYPAAGGSYPASYAGGVFFADHTRNCIWFIPRGTNGEPDPAQRLVFIEAAANPVDLVIGPGTDLFYVDFDAGSIRRVSAIGGNQPPTAVIAANPTSGPAPLTVQFSGSGSSDPEGTPLTYAWDLDNDGAFDDGTGVTASRTYNSPGNVTVRLLVTDAGLATGTDSEVISVSNSPPVPVISTPTAGTTFKVGDVINFSGSASDAQDGALPASSLTWTLVQQHCPSTCHSHIVQTFVGVASGSFSAPDHDYPSYLELTLTATDSFGTTASVTRRLDPQTVVLTFQSVPSGLSLAVGATSAATPFQRTVIIGSQNSVSATSPQTLAGTTYSFASWSDGGAQTHTIVAPATNTTYTATYASTGLSFLPTADAYIRSNQANKNFGTQLDLRVRVNQYRVYLKFTVTGLSGPPAAATLRLWVTGGGSSGGSIYRLTNTTWTETGITWNNAPAISGTPLSTAGVATAGTFLDFNLGSAITGDGTYTFAISNGGTAAVDYASRETANDPVLLITP